MMSRLLEIKKLSNLLYTQCTDLVVCKDLGLHIRDLCSPECFTVLVRPVFYTLLLWFEIYIDLFLIQFFLKLTKVHGGRKVSTVAIKVI